MSTQRQSSQEILCIQVGGCGNQVGEVFWDQLRQEYGIDNTGTIVDTSSISSELLENIEVFFKKTSDGKYLPRTINVDLDPATLDSLRASSISKLLLTDNYFFSTEGTNNNWAKGFYTKGAELINEIMAGVKKELDACANPQGVILFHSLGGGTGSGLGSLILSKIKTMNPDLCCVTYSVFPSPKVSDVVVEPYNATLTIHQLSKHADLVFVIDAGAIFSMMHFVLKNKNPKSSDFSWTIANIIRDSTSPLRLGYKPWVLRDIVAQMVSYPGFNFVIFGGAPIYPEEAIGKLNVRINEIAVQAISDINNMTGTDFVNGKILNSRLIIRGNTTDLEVYQERERIKSRLDSELAQWIPNNFGTSHLSTPTTHSKISGIFIANSTAIKSLFQRISEHFHEMYSRKAFLHWYKGEGMHQMELEAANVTVLNLISKYEEVEKIVIENQGSGPGSGTGSPEEEE
ncbi:hypothetical protein [Microbulbifer epialgicus]|uniref:Tubulin/FtsZ GTPase domain-containing protein n=1 Tax=Microbulbifer epialgicus TaxID=393907 RepID=A0ABV4NTX1_9GAMM